MPNPTYRVLGVVDATEIPDWERKPPKWADLVDQVLALKPDQSLQLLFDSVAEAKNARNAVRDTANRRAGAVAIRTRLIKNDNGTAELYLLRVRSPSEKEA